MSGYIGPTGPTGFTIVLDTTSTKMYPVFVSSTGPNQILNIDTELTPFEHLSYIPSTGILTAIGFSTASDYRIKENAITIYGNETFTIDNLRPVTYTNKISGKQDIGLIAHELQEHYPFLVTGEKDGPNNQSVNYTCLIPILIKEIKELKERVKILESTL